MTDIYFGDLSLIPGGMLQHINEVSERRRCSHLQL